MKKNIVAMMAVAGLAGMANAQTHNESGDAGNLAPQMTGAGTLTQISGAFDVTGDSDVFAIRVDDWATFSADAFVNAGTETDTQMFLFDAAGFGIAFNDDDPSGAGGLRSVMPAGNSVYSGRTNGEIVWIGISGYNVDPSSAGGLIWLNSPFNTVRAPDGAGAASPVISWAGTGSSGTYNIVLTGVSAVPAPGALALLGLGGLVAARRRRD